MKHITAAPYHPATNGLAERAVQFIKKGLKKMTEGSIQTRIARVLSSYRVTPQSTTGVSPAELLLGRLPRTRLDLLKLNMAKRVESKQNQQKQNHDFTARSRALTQEDKVYVKTFGQGQRWLPGEIVEVTGPVSFMVKLLDGRLLRYHQDNLRIRKDNSPTFPQDLQEEEMSAPT